MEIPRCCDAWPECRPYQRHRTKSDCIDAKDEQIATATARAEQAEQQVKVLREALNKIVAAFSEVNL